MKSYKTDKNKLKIEASNCVINITDNLSDVYGRNVCSISIPEVEILQCRSAFNKKPRRYNEIIHLIEDNVTLFHNPKRIIKKKQIA